MSDFKLNVNNIDPHLFSGMKIGLEKEALRVEQAGYISRQEHPRSLGAPLTHPYITTDYAEALLELVTPPRNSSAKVLEHLEFTQSYVYRHLGHEMLWTTSMPCALESEDDIKLAQYGHSNMGQLKHIYRRGLGHRYGKLMQIIAGIHFNFSFSLPLWQNLHGCSRSAKTLRQFRDQSYMDTIRNIQRYGWLIIYLFGASPAISKSFLGGVPGSLKKLDFDSFFEPYATSLRMGDIGYTNSKEGKSGFRISYSNIQEYLSSMRRAITTPCSEYEKLGVYKKGEYQQLNCNILQIENEHYSSVRPKQLLQGLEKPVDALQDRGIEYIELRSLDINPYFPSGINLQQMNFLEVFMNFCLLNNSADISLQEQHEINLNQSIVAHRGRKPGLKLQRQGQVLSLKEWGKQIFESLQVVAEQLDLAFACQRYSNAVKQQLKVVEDPNLTPSAKILMEMLEKKESFMAFSLRKSQQHREYFLNLELAEKNKAYLSQIAKESIRKQTIEEKDSQSFREFLEQYLGNDDDNAFDCKENVDKRFACL